MPHKGGFISSPYPSPTSDHFSTNMVCLNISPFLYGLFVIAYSGAKLTIHVDSCFSPSEKKPQLH